MNAKTIFQKFLIIFGSFYFLNAGRYGRDMRGIFRELRVNAKRSSENQGGTKG